MPVLWHVPQTICNACSMSRTIKPFAMSVPWHVTQTICNVCAMASATNHLQCLCHGKCHVCNVCAMARTTNHLQCLCHGTYHKPFAMSVPWQVPQTICHVCAMECIPLTICNACAMARTSISSMVRAKTQIDVCVWVGVWVGVCVCVC